MESEKESVQPITDFYEYLKELQRKHKNALGHEGEAVPQGESLKLEKDFEKELSAAQLEKITQENIGLRDRTEARKEYTGIIFTVVVMWLVFMIIIVVATGKGSLKLSDTVLVALLGTTTTAVTLLFSKVANYLFGDKK